jgi:hypothetical protein
MIVSFGDIIGEEVHVEPSAANNAGLWRFCPLTLSAVAACGTAASWAFRVSVRRSSPPACPAASQAGRWNHLRLLPCLLHQDDELAPWRENGAAVRGHTRRGGGVADSRL